MNDGFRLDFCDDLAPMEARDLQAASLKQKRRKRDCLLTAVGGLRDSFLFFHVLCTVYIHALCLWWMGD